MTSSQHNSISVGARLRRLALPAIFGLVASQSAWAQPHTAVGEQYEVRASTVNSVSISEETAKAHNIQRGGNTGLLNVTVMHKENGRTVPARVTAVARNLTGLSREIDMRETIANGYVSYSGAYPIVTNEVIDFEITAQVPGAEPIRMSFRDRMLAR